MISTYPPVNTTSRLAGIDNGVDRAEEETLVVDGRGQLTPSQQVEQKLINLLKASPLPVSQVQRRLRPGPR